MDQFLGEIRLLPYTFAPEGWVDCDGRHLKVNDYEDLFAVIGTTYGGDGQTDFAVPDLRGRIPVAAGQRPGASAFKQGSKGGDSTATLSSAQMPAHTHNVLVSKVAATGTTVAGNALAAPTGDVLYTQVESGMTEATLSSAMVGSAGGLSAFETAPHDNMMPTTFVRYCMAVTGEFPERS